MSILGVVEGYQKFLDTHRDPRTADWFLSGKLGQLAIILFSYVYFCTKAGPRYMKDRKPYELKTTIQIYNIVQIVSSVYLVYLGLTSGWLKDYSYTCQPVEPGDKGLPMARAVWLYFICKLTELLDTVFFVLRKKHHQISYLHLYHHSLMPLCAWIGVTFLPGGHGTLLGLINSFVHVIMYVYYLLASLGPRYQKYLWWKKYLTVVQLIQFIIVFYHNLQTLFTDCAYPKVINILLTIQAVYFFYLFAGFYVRTYIRAKRKSSKSHVNGIKEEISTSENNKKIN